MGYEYKGTVVEVGETKQISDNFSVRNIVVSQDATKKNGESFLKRALFQFGNASMLDGISAGQTVTVSFDLDARNHNGTWYGNARGYKIVAEEGGQYAQSQAGNIPTAARKVNPPAETADDDDSTLPF